MRFPALAVLAAFLAACAGQPPAPVSSPSPSAAQPPPPAAEPAKPTAPSGNVAVASLVQSARADTAAGRLGNAAATLERALRIEPRNPRLLQELALVRLKQGEYGQAEQIALKANSFAGSDSALRAENWRLIAQAREARGDSQGAQAALETAARIGR
jgi:predicted Zn-dependent protease